MIISLAFLMRDSVSVQKRNTVEINGVEQPYGEWHSKAYSNSTLGRAELADEVPEPYLSTVMTLWGDTPTVSDDDTDD